jgi:hypothetical protein
MASGNGGGINNLSSMLSINHTTIAKNTANSGGGINNISEAEAISHNSIISDNNALAAPDFRGTLISNGYNLIGNTTDTTITGDLTGNIIGVAPLFDPNGLQNNGGLTKTIALLQNSPAVDSADPQSTLTSDQRGVTRPLDGNGDGILRSDMGAFEFDSFSPRSVFFDFDGDGKSDLSVFRPNEGVWYLLRSSGGFTGFEFGLASDRLVPADYDGDRVTDAAVWREGKFYIMQSSDGTVREENFGLPGDDPSTVGDWDGDGKADVAVYRDTDHKFYFRGTFNNPNNNISVLPWGMSGDMPVHGDFDGDGKFDAAVFRPSNGVWYILQSYDSKVISINFGSSTDKFVPADYDGDGKTDIAVYRPSSGIWYILQSRDGLTAFQFGISTDKPVPADYDGDGRADAAVYRDGVWFILGSTSGVKIEVFGLSTDKPIPNVFIP